VSPAFIIISVATVPIGVILTLYRRSLERADAETGQTFIAEERIAAQFDNVKLPQPLVRAAVYQDFMVVAGWNTVVEKYEDLSGVEIRHMPLEKFEARMQCKDYTVTLLLPKNSVILDTLRKKLSVKAWRT
jgi:hypothetical protein